MRSGQDSSGKSNSNPQEYPLDDLQEDDSSNSSQFVTVPRRGSADSVENEEHSSEPLLPTSAVHLPSKHERDDRFSCSISGILNWVKGPRQPYRYRINPWLARWQTAPERLIQRYFPSKKGKVFLLLAALGFWSIVFLSVLNSSVSGLEIPGFGTPSKLSCTTKLWSDASDCGINGDYCRPFDKEAFAFRCPAGCAGAIVLEPYTVGSKEINYQSLVIGGGNNHNGSIYRGDSFICGAALHAGLIEDHKGGCGILRRRGEQSSFPSIERNGISSIEFPSNFPLSFSFDGDVECRQDLRWPLFTFSVILSTVLSLCIASPAAFYSSIFFIVWFQVALSSDPPEHPDFYEVVSIALGRLLPTAFVGFAIYYFCIRHTLSNLDAHWDKTVLWLGACWVGALNTDTFDKIPISRLTPHDIQQQPGAIPALIIIITTLVLIVITQALAFRNEGRLPKMLAIYGTLVAGILALIVVPHMNLRIHHYILGLLFLPGTTMQTRPCLLYQGLLVGLFLNGIARWGYDSILQTPASLLNGAQLGTPLPQIAPPFIPSPHHILISFTDVDIQDADADGISVQVNDVERFRAFKGDEDTIESFNWTRRNAGETEYFRFAFVKQKARGGFWYEDFTHPVVWDVDGGWNRMQST